MRDIYNKKQLTLTRIFNAPRELVWDAVTKPEHFRKWYGSFNSTLSDLVMDVREGGSWSAIMHIPKVPDISWRGDYREVVTPERLVFALRNPEDHDDPEVEIVTFTFKELDGGSQGQSLGKTEMVFNQSGNLPDVEYERWLKEGWISFFDRLEEHLKAETIN